MDSRMIERIKNHIKNHKMAIIVFVCVLVAILSLDTWQQERFGEVDKAYYLMSQGKYDEAVQLFEDYLSVESSVYWAGIERVNGKYADYCTRENVEEALKQCQDKMVIQDKN